jgi:acyl-CoA synthetase (AMP-forming)/AMP-acid ligase II
VAYQPDRSTAPESLKELIEDRARATGSSPYVVAVRSGRVVTYLELALRMNEWRREVALRPSNADSRFGLLIADPLDFAVTFVCLLACGLWVAPLDPALADMSALQLGERIRPLKLTAVISDRPAPAGVGVDWRPVIATSDQSDKGRSPDLAPTSGGGVILASSGTSGTPKVVALSSRQLLQTAWLVARHNELETIDRGFNPLPLWHINAEVVAVLATLVAGASVAIDERFHRTDFWSTIERLGVTWINAVPAIVARLTILREGERVPEGVRFVRSASAPLAPALLAQFEYTVKIPVVETYGMTEAASQICANPLAGPRKSGSVGRPVGVELRLRHLDPDPGDSSVDPLVGEVEIRGPSVIDRYESSHLDDRFDADGWLSTGDQGYLDDDGYLFLVGRTDDVINRGGEKIFPREIEEAVLDVLGVANAAVIGVSDEVFGQVPVLYVQVQGVEDESSTDLVETVFAEIRLTLTAAFARTRRPVEMVVVQLMPTHATGKIQKKLLTNDSVVVLKRLAFKW